MRAYLGPSSNLSLTGVSAWGVGQHRDRPAEGCGSRGWVGVAAGGWGGKGGGSGWEGGGLGWEGGWWVWGRGDGGVMIMSNTALPSRYSSPQHTKVLYHSNHVGITACAMKLPHSSIESGRSVWVLLMGVHGALERV